MHAPLRILHLEDNANDAELVRALLEADGLTCEVVRVETREAFVTALEWGRFDLILSDFSMPGFDGLTALTLTRSKGVDTPFIFVSGTIGEESAVITLQCGATDYVLKGRMTRLPSAVRRALREVEEEADLKRIGQALQEAQERFRSIYESSKDAIGYATLDGRLLDVNGAYAKLTGYAREELLALKYQELTPPEYHSLTAEMAEQVIETGEAVEYEKEFIRKDGSRVPVALTVFAVKGNDGKPIGLAAIIKDMTERKRLEQEFLQAQKMEVIGQLAGGIAHDFNNLLTVITGYSELLLQTLKPDDPQHGDIEQIKLAGQRAAALTRQLLAFSRRQVLAPAVLDLNEVVANLKKMLGPLIGEDMNLVTALDQSLGRVKADPGQIEQVIMNLAVNARDAMPQGGQLTIETKNVELDDTYARTHLSVRPGPYVMLAVSDTGTGMDAETQARIFEPFFTTKEQGKGTGLGLATVYGIVKQSGGDIWVYSEPGKGTVFKIYLPRVEETGDLPKPTQPRVAVLQGSETLLLVEDEAMLRTLVRTILLTSGYTVLEAQDGDEAVRICREHRGPIHLLITDMIMPGISGPELAERLASLRPAMKVLHMSGYTDHAVVRQGVLEEGTVFLQKPFTPDSLMRKVREALDSR